ncbi:MAG: HAD family hydrolase [Bryobacteraceae bacterium]|nr:HAD family hydrolase [Bryobacteraceae bacterium]
MDGITPQARSHLIIDADDTLWENNIYFEDAFAAFLEFLDHSHLPPAQIRAIFDEMELANIRVNGYGAANFARNMTQCYRHLVEREVKESDIAHVLSLGQRILDAPIELLPGVGDTLAELATRHELTLFTKGDLEEQRLKVERSGVAHHFTHLGIVREKNAPAYRQLVGEREMDPAKAWMIGNSPKSDINPALECGLGAVFIPHERTWSLEQQELRREAPRLIVLERFPDLCRIF